MRTLTIGHTEYNLEALKGYTKTKFLKEKLGTEEVWKKIEDVNRKLAKKGK